MTADRGFPPLIIGQPKVLILGSMPSQKSLEKQEYYGHSQNAFWKIMARQYGFAFELDYAKRAKIVSSKGIVIWDVIQSCIRPGSLDSSIEKDSVVINDFENLFHKYPSIKKVLFNGGTAEKLFKQHLKTWIKAHPEIELIKLPSTSPAHASLNLDQKYDLWRVHLLN